MTQVRAHRPLRLVIAALGALLVMVPRSAFAQEVSLEVKPDSITAYSAEFTADARVVLKNPGTQTLRRLSLSGFSNDGISAEVGKANTAITLPKEEITWPVKVVVPRNAHLPGSIIFDASYVTSSGARHVYKTLSVQSDGAQKLVEVSIEGNLETVSQYRPSSIYLQVTNNTDVPVSVTIASQVTSAAIEVPPVSPFQVAPHSSTACKVEVKVKSRVTPGVHPILFDVSASWEWAGHKQERHFSLTKSAAVGVFFESEVLKALGIPSFLVLPGCLMIFTMQLLLNFGVLGLKDESKLPDLGVTSPGFWILSISFSGIFAWFYFYVTQVNYLVSYGVDDLRNVWLASIAIGVVLYLAIASVVRWRRRDLVPSNDDNALTILRKLGRNGLSVLRPRVKYKLGNLEQTGFVIETIEDGQNLVWIAPHITVDWKASPDAQAQK